MLAGIPAHQAASGVSAEGERHPGHGDPRQGASGEPAADESGCSGAGHQRQGAAGEPHQGGAGSHAAAEGESVEQGSGMAAERNDSDSITTPAGGSALPQATEQSDSTDKPLK